MLCSNICFVLIYNSDVTGVRCLLTVYFIKDNLYNRFFSLVGAINKSPIFSVLLVMYCVLSAICLSVKYLNSPSYDPPWIQWRHAFKKKQTWMSAWLWISQKKMFITELTLAHILMSSQLHIYCIKHYVDEVWDRQHEPPSTVHISRCTVKTCSKSILPQGGGKAPVLCICNTV